MTATFRDRILAESNKRGADSFRVLIVFGNPLGNPLGDTLIAAQHLRYLETLPRCAITIWTNSADAWRFAANTEIEVLRFLEPAEFVSSFDLILIDWIKIGADLKVELDRTDATILLWETRSGNPQIRIGNSWQELALSPMMNQPERIGQFYSALGFSESCARSYRGRTAQYIYFNPYGSTARKSVPEEIAVSLLGILSERVPGRSILIARPPASDIPYDRRVFAEIESSLDLFSHKNVRHLDRMRTGEYLALVAGAAFCISADTSTQHAAGISGVPSITLYEPGSGYSYLFWGWPSKHSYHFRFPHHKQPEVLAAVVASLVNRCLHFDTGGEAPPPVLIALTERYKEQLADVCKMSRPSELELLEELVQKIAAVLPEKYHTVVLPELRIVNREVSRPQSRELLHGDLVRRISSINALKVIEGLYGSGSYG